MTVRSINYDQLLFFRFFLWGSCYICSVGCVPKQVGSEAASCNLSISKSWSCYPTMTVNDSYDGNLRDSPCRCYSIPGLTVNRSEFLCDGVCMVVKVNTDAALRGARVLSQVALPPARPILLFFAYGTQEPRKPHLNSECHASPP